MTKPTLTEQAEAVLARAKAIEAYTPRDLANERIWEECIEEVHALFRILEDLMADVDNLVLTPFGQDEDRPYEQMVSDQLHEDAES